MHDAGTDIVIPHLAGSLDLIAREGARAFYEGELGDAIVAHIAAGGGALTRADMRNYEAIERQSLSVDIGRWSVASNPPPAVGGATLAAMLLSCVDLPFPDWRRESLAHLIDVQRAVLDFRKSKLDLADDVATTTAELLEQVRTSSLPGKWTSASTVHTSAVDDSGIACAVTASSGYGSGEMAPGTGIWLNNCLGELELNRRGLDAGPPGARLPSNMSPTVARSGSTVIAAGSPGADRITTALHQFFVNYMQFNMSLDEAIGHPRVHVDTSGETVRLMAEPGLDLPEVDIPVHVTSGIGMYFGGVGVALYDSESGFAALRRPVP